MEHQQTVQNLNGSCRTRRLPRFCTACLHNILPYGSASIRLSIMPFSPEPLNYLSDMLIIRVGLCMNIFIFYPASRYMYHRESQQGRASDGAILFFFMHVFIYIVYNIWNMCCVFRRWLFGALLSRQRLGE